MTPTTRIRGARSEDYPEITSVITAAFGQPAEARLVAALRADGDAAIELVAIDGNAIAGHVMASPMRIDANRPLGALGVAPLSVLPSRQGQGIGSALMRELIDQARADGVDALLLLGDPAYYSRFGFRPAALGNDYGAEDAFQSLSLRPGCLDGITGHARYAPAFATLEGAA